MFFRLKLHELPNETLITMTITKQLTHSTEAWKYLRGLVCLYKLPQYPLSNLITILKSNCSMDLNHMKRTVESEGQELISDGNSQGNFLGNNEAGLIESKQKLILSTKSTDIMTTSDIRYKV